MPLSILVVDDSALMRKRLREMLETEQDFEVHVARDGEDALKRIAEVDPDIVTLDINMPVMDGLTCLHHIMSEMPRPVIMLSSLTTQGALATFEALELGAVDFLGKPDGTVSTNIAVVREQLVQKIRYCARRNRASRLHKIESTTPRAKGTPQGNRMVGHPRGRAGTSATKVVVIGVSTGGPRALETLLPVLPADFPATVLVAQHMPASFTPSFAERLNRRCPMTVREVSGQTALQPGEVLIARGDADMVVTKRGGQLVAVSVPADSSCRWHPSVDRLAESAGNQVNPKELVAILLTGMGNDGARSMAALHRRGTPTIAESEETAVVFGMPRELIELGGASVVLPLPEVAGTLLQWVGCQVEA